uniref:L-rhamnose-binding lectin CSL2-like isoform X2 n=1 Tax=Scatophagus argus TaxID=75038 RepID=UPI001ED85EF8|nr:L-rhamnose-binding lectin CSL2-like isoform X2 [Scatophagus argus]
MLLTCFCVFAVLTVFCCSVMTRQEVMLTCDLQNFAQKLDCRERLIIIQNVEVSHRETEVCVDGARPNRTEPPLCSSTPMLHIVKERCNGRYRCTVPMDLCHVNLPCVTRCVWMETTYTCEAGRIHHACQQEKAALHCGPQVIKMLTTNYGRTSKMVCEYSAPHSQPPSTSCYLPNALQVMANRCDGKHRCSVRASNLIFSNPCPGTLKYLQYSYTCVDPGGRSSASRLLSIKSGLMCSRHLLFA